MADKFNPVFHYTEFGEEKTVTGGAYSVQDYIDWGLENLTGDELKIVKALADYGYHAQPYLSAQNGWTIGTDYAEMKTHVTDSYDYDEVRLAAQQYAIVRATNDKILKVMYRLRFGSEITLRIKFYPAEGETVSNVMVATDPVEPKKSGDYYYVDIEGIKATELAETYGVNAEKALTLVSPMSYVYSVLVTPGTSDEAKNLVCALYYYAQACKGAGLIQ